MLVFISVSALILITGYPIYRQWKKNKHKNCDKYIERPAVGGPLDGRTVKTKRTADSVICEGTKYFIRNYEIDGKKQEAWVAQWHGKKYDDYTLLSMVG